MEDHVLPLHVPAPFFYFPSFTPSCSPFLFSLPSNGSLYLLILYPCSDGVFFFFSAFLLIRFLSALNPHVFSPVDGLSFSCSSFSSWRTPSLSCNENPVSVSFTPRSTRKAPNARLVGDFSLVDECKLKVPLDFFYPLQHIY